MTDTVPIAYDGLRNTEDDVYLGKCVGIRSPSTWPIFTPLDLKKVVEVSGSVVNFKTYNAVAKLQ